MVSAGVSWQSGTPIFAIIAINGFMALHPSVTNHFLATTSPQQTTSLTYTCIVELCIVELCVVQVAAAWSCVGAHSIKKGESVPLLSRSVVDSVDMEKRSWTSVLVLSFWASIVVVAAQIPRGTEHFTLPGTSSNESCAGADCQQGTCVPNDNVLVSILFPYKCQCNPGWATLQKVAPLLIVPSLPCNVPNCSLNLNCSGDSPAAAPSPSSPITSASVSLCLVPGICGHGTCEVVSGANVTSSIKCVCDPGYSNVLNTTGGYCVNKCEINGECLSLNMTLPGLSPPPPPGSPAANQTSPNAGYRGISFNSGLYVIATLAMVWSFLMGCY